MFGISLRRRKRHVPTRRQRLTLEYLEDWVLPAMIFTVTSTGDGGTGGTLREAITSANNNPGLDTIDFNIPGTGAHTIQLLSALPDITSPVLIDGTSQPGFAGSPLIQLDGAQAGDNVVGLSISAGNSTIQGLVISHFSSFGIIVGSNNNVIQGNYIGTDLTGMIAEGNGQDGVNISGGAQGNRIGSNLDGVNDAAEANVISGNQRHGAVVQDPGSNQNSVQGNFIGTDPTGTKALGNAGNGVEIKLMAQNNSVRRNTIFGNGGLGITLGVTFAINHIGGPVAGPNQMQNYPLILSATPGSSTAAIGTLNSLANTTFTLDFYASSAPDRSLYGQGQRYLGSTTVSTDTAGNASFSVVLPAASSSGEWLTVTATDPSGNTSEFSQARPLPTAAPTLSPTAWTPLGPAPLTITGFAGNLPFTGKINGMAGDPSNANILYVATSLGGVWKTTNGGTTWTPLTDTQTTLAIGSIALAPSNPNIIYAGTGDTNDSGNAFYGRGLLKSTDAGATWTLLANNLFNRRSIGRIAVDPSNPDIIYIATGIGIVNGLSGNVGVWKSIDGGNNWIDTTATIPNISHSQDLFSTVLFDPGDPTHQTLYTAVCSRAGSFFGFSPGSGVYKTTDGGTTWTLLAGGMPSGPTVGHIELALSPSAPQTVYASIIGTGQPGSTAFGSLFEMLKSTDGGATWTTLTNTPDYFSENQGWFDSTLAVDPGNANIVYAGGDAIFLESADGGASWTDIHLGTPLTPNVPSNTGVHNDHHGIGFDANGKLLDGNDGGIYRLDNPALDSIQWTDLNGNLNITQFTGIALDPTNPNLAYGGSQDNGTDIFNGAGWLRVRGGDGGFVRVDSSHPSTIYHTFNWSGNAADLQRSDDGGATWTNETTGINLTDPANFYPPYVMDPSQTTRLLFGTNRVYETLNRGDSWSPISTVGANGWPGTISSPIDSLAVAPSAPGTIYVTTQDSHVLVTFDDGATWQLRDIPGLSNHFSELVDVEVDPFNNMIAYAVRNPFNDFGASGHLFRTTNGGMSWSDISGNLPDLPAYTVAIDPQHTSTLYLGNDNGVYVSLDSGNSWSRFGTGLPNVQVVQLELSTSLGILAAGTHGRGLWEIELPGAKLHVQVTPSAGAVIGGGSFNLTVSILDSSNNPVAGYRGTVHFTSTDGNPTLPADYTFAAGDAGTHTFSGLVLRSPGNQSITVTDTVSNSITASANVTVNPAAPSTLVVSGFPASTMAGVSGSFTVVVQDTLGNTVSGYTGTVRFTSSDPQAQVPANYTFTASDAGKHIFSATFKTTGTPSLTAIDTMTNSITGTQSGIAVTPGPTVTVLVAGFPAPSTAGVASGFMVTAKDAFGNTTPGYRGMLHFTSTDPLATLPANYAFTAADNGLHLFSAGLKKAGTQSLTATDTVTPSITGSQAGITVRPAAASTLAVSGFASTVTAGVTGSFTVTAKDPFGNTATGYAGTVHFTSNDSQAVLPANATLTSGAGTFSAILRTAGTQSLTGTDTGIASITGSQTGLVVNPAAAIKLMVSGLPGVVTPGTSGAFTVTAKDAFGNTATAYAGIVHFTSTDGLAVLPADASLSGGTGIFTAAFKTAGSQSITATDIVSPTISGTQSAISVGHLTATFGGIVFQDVNIDGAQDQAKLDGVHAAPEHGLKDAMFFIDLDGSGILKPADPTVISDANGNYRFTVSNPGTYTIREVLPPAQPPAIALGGLLLEAPANNAHQVTITSSTTLAGINFANVPTSIAVPLTLPLTTPFPKQGSANADYVEAVYRTVLNRDAEPAGLAFWTNLLTKGTLSRLQVVQGIRTSPEHFTQEVTDFYFSILNRPPDPTGLQSWVFQLQQGMLTEEEVAFKFLDSPEYLSKGDKFFVDHMYLSLLGRAFDFAGEAFWLNELGDNSSGNPTHPVTLTHEQVITAFMRSPESLNRLVQGYYQIFLQRLADPPGMNFWLSGLHQGQSFLTIGQDFLTSSEFYNNAAAEG